MEKAAVQTRSAGGKYLTLALGDETYAVQILCVREIIGLTPITAVPRTPEYVRGVINLRGKIISVIDLRLKFGMACREHCRETCIVIVDLIGATGSTRIGVIVDSVNEVIDVNPGEIEAVPSFGTRVDTSFLLGLIRSRNAIKLLLDIEKVLKHEDIAAMQKISAADASSVASPGKNTEVA